MSERIPCNTSRWFTARITNDLIVGNSQRNVINGGPGADEIRGGDAGDEFYYLPGDLPALHPDTISKFDGPSGDCIDISEIGVKRGNWRNAKSALGRRRGSPPVRSR